MGITLHPQPHESCLQPCASRCVKVLVTIPAQALSRPDLPFTPEQLGEKANEEAFGQARAGSGSGADRMFSLSVLRDRLRRAFYRMRAKRDSNPRRTGGLPSLGDELDGCYPTLPRAEQCDRLFKGAMASAFERVHATLHQLEMAPALIASGYTALRKGALAVEFDLQVVSGPRPPPVLPAAATTPATAPPAPHAAGADGDDVMNDGPAALMVAAAEDIVAAHENGEELTVECVQRSLLRHVADGDLEETALSEQQALAAVVSERATCTEQSREHGRNFHLFYEGRFWQISELVRMLDGFITITDRGRAARFWNVMAKHYQSVAAQHAACEAQVAAMAAGDGEDAEEAEHELGDDAAAAGPTGGPESSNGVLRRGHVAAVWMLGSSEDEPGKLGLVRVRSMYGRGPKVGYRMLQALDISKKETVGFIWGERLTFDIEEEFNEVSLPSAGELVVSK